MSFERQLQALSESVSGARTRRDVAALARHHRIQASSGYDEALNEVVERLELAGVEATVSSFPADGRTATYGWTAPMGWSIRSGELRQLEPEEGVLCSFDEVPISVLGQSGGGRASGELVHVGKVTRAAALDGVDVEGRFVLACGRARQIVRGLRGRGALGVVIYPDSERAAVSHEFIPYAGLFPTADEVDSTPMAFAVSRRAADRLLAQLAEGAVRLHAAVDATAQPGALKVLEATIAGSDREAGEVLLVAHLCHPMPSANDNGSGSGALLETARALAELARSERLANTVRLLWVPEFNGTLPWVAANRATLHKVHFVINLDMVGQSPERIGEPLRVFRAPVIRPTVLNACFEPIVAWIARTPGAVSSQGSRRPLHALLDRPSGGSDHLVFQAPPCRLPAVMIGHEDPYWHTSHDTIDNVDASRLQQAAILAAAVASLPSWGRSEVQRLRGWLLAYSVRELSWAADLGRKWAPDRATDVLAEARIVEEARLQSLVSVVGADPGGLQEALQAAARALGGPEALKVPRSSTGPRRIQDGPVRFDVTEAFDEEERAFFDEVFSAHHRAAVETLINLCDGTRDIERIALALMLDVGRPFTAADVDRGIDLLARAGYVAA